MNTETIPNGFRQDAQGRLVPVDQIKEIDLARDEIVSELVGRAKDLAGIIGAFKNTALGEIQAFVELSAEKYDAKLGGRKGNVTLTSYDGRYKIIRALSDGVEFDERLQAAKSLIDECLTEWSEGARPELKTIVHDAFSTDKKGNLATHKILSLRRIKITDTKWIKAMEAISDSLTVTSSKTYVRFYECMETGEYKQISLDPTEL